MPYGGGLMGIIDKIGHKEVKLIGYFLALVSGIGVIIIIIKFIGTFQYGIVSLSNVLVVPILFISLFVVLVVGLYMAGLKAIPNKISNLILKFAKIIKSWMPWVNH